ncbi:MAG: sulfite exporter TauE/SafE family protein [Sediminibacterium sp.]
MDNLALFFILALIAEIIGTVSGFGSSILFIPMAAMFFDFKIVLGITAVFHVFSNVFKIFLFRKGVDRSVLHYLGIPAVISVIIGAVLTAYIPVKIMEMAMSVVVLAIAVYMIFNQRMAFSKSNTNLIVGGTVSGFLAGLVGTGGAIRGLTLAAFELEKNAFVATSAVIDLGVDASRAGIYIWNGYFQSEHIKLIPMLIFIALVGSYVGKLILEKTSNEFFRYTVLLVIVATSIWQIIKMV